MPLTPDQYEKIAKLFKSRRIDKHVLDMETEELEVDGTVEAIAAELALVLEEDNVYFDKKKFLTACGCSE